MSLDDLYIIAQSGNFVNPFYQFKFTTFPQCFVRFLVQFPEIALTKCEQEGIMKTVVLLLKF